MDATPTAFLCMLAKVFSYFHLNANSDELTRVCLSASLCLSDISQQGKVKTSVSAIFKVVFSSSSPGFLKVIQ